MTTATIDDVSAKVDTLNTNTSALLAAVTTTQTALVSSVAGSTASATSAASSATAASSSAALALAIYGTASAQQAAATTTAAGVVSVTTSAAAAAGSAAALAASLASFRSKYLGGFATDPTLDGNGAALVAGAEYFSTTSNKLRTYSGSAWGDYDATAQTETTSATLSASQATGSASSAGTSATNAASSASAATTQAGIATTQAGNSSASASAASASAGTAATQSVNAAASASAAGTSAANAAASAASVVRDGSGGVAGLTLFKLNLKNAAGAVTSWLTNAATAARTWTFPDYDGTVSMQAGTETLSNKTLVAPALGTPASGNLANCSFPSNLVTTNTLSNNTLTASVASLAVVGNAPVDQTVYLTPGSGALGKGSIINMSANFGATYGGSDYVPRQAARIHTWNPGNGAWNDWKMDFELRNGDDSGTWDYAMRLARVGAGAASVTIPGALMVGGGTSTNAGVTPLAPVHLMPGEAENRGIVFGHPNWPTKYYAAIWGHVVDGENNTRGDIHIGIRRSNTDASLTDAVIIDANGTVAIPGALSVSGGIVVPGTIAVAPNLNAHQYHIDAGTPITLANGGFIDIGNFSGMLMVNNWNSGAIGIWLCGGGYARPLSGAGDPGITTTYNSAQSGYTLYNSSGASMTLSVFAVRTRAEG